MGHPGFAVTPHTMLNVGRKNEISRDRYQRSGYRYRNRMTGRKEILFGHEKLDVYQLLVKYVSSVFEQSDDLCGKHRHARDQWLRASQSIPLNIAEGNGKSTDPDRRRFFVPSRRRHPSIARGSALECAAIQDVLDAGNAISQECNLNGRELLNRIVGMLTKLSRRNYCVAEEQAPYGVSEIRIDYDSDSRYTDSDSEKTRFQQIGEVNGENDSAVSP